MFALIIVGLIFFTFILFFVGLVYQGQKIRVRSELFDLQNPTPEQLLQQEKYAIDWIMEGGSVLVEGKNRYRIVSMFPEEAEHKGLRRLQLAKNDVQPLIRFQLLSE